MPSNTQKLKRDLEGYLSPQHFNEDNDEWEATKGIAGAASAHALGSIIVETWEGSADITKTLPKLCVGFSIKNDSTTADITVTIGTNTFKVKAEESFGGNFEPFSTVTITTTAPYRALAAR